MTGFPGVHVRYRIVHESEPDILENIKPVDTKEPGKFTDHFIQQTMKKTIRVNGN